MKRMIMKIIFPVFILGSVPAQAGLGQMTKDAAHCVLQKIGNNPGWVAYAGLTYFMYRYIVEEESPNAQAEVRWGFFQRTLRGSIPVGAAAIALSAACKWWASKIK